MNEARMWNWQRIRAFSTGALFAFAGVWGFWAHREQSKASREILPVEESAQHPPPAFQVVTTTLDGITDGLPAQDLTWNWRYDDEGRLVEILAPGGVTTNVAYSETLPEPRVMTSGERRVFARDPRGRLVSAEGPTGKVAFGYDSLGLPSTVSSEGVPPLLYSFDVFGRLSAWQVGEGPVLQYRYDYLGRLATIATPAGDITYSYNTAKNTVVRSLPNGVQTVRTYSDEGVLLQLAHADRHNYILAAFEYKYRPDGLIASITDTNQRIGQRTWRYVYDLMHRLTAVECDGDGPSYSYRYDALGNLMELRTSAQELRFTNTPAGALAGDSRGPARVDARGHVRQLPSSKTPLEFRYTSFGELSAVNNDAVTYSYNALGLLVAREVDGRATQYLPDPFADAWRPLWQRATDGIEKVTLWDGAVPLMEIQGDTVSYRLEDHLASVRLELDPQGQPVAWHDYAAFGTPLTSSADEDLRPGFAGLFWDPDAKIYHALARAYDPVTARFLQPDARIRVPGLSKHSHSLYAYCGGDPINFADRNGAEAVWLHGGTPMMTTEGRGFSVGTQLHPGRDTHLGRNWDMRNRFPDMQLAPTTKKTLLGKSTSDPSFQYKLFGNNDYVAESGRIWTLQPDFMNALHQPEYPFLQAVFGRLDPQKKFYKFLSPDGTGGSYEAILGRDASGNWVWVNTGLHAATYNYVHPVDPLSPGVLASVASAAKGGPMALQAGSPFGQVLLSWAGHYGRDMSPSSQFGENYRRFAPNMPYPSPYREDIIIPAREFADVMKSRVETLMEMRQRYDQQHDYLQYDRINPSYEGMVAGPGGYPSQRHSDLLALWRDSASGSSPVGGVALAGAGKALQGFGRLQGVAIDATSGRMVLIGSDDKQFSLPPLHLDDIVTVFRAVYDHGQAPSVTIDPDGRQPTGPVMHVKHGPGTAFTYVGWILYECDRVMKTYHLGRDNLTGATVSSQVAGHADTLDAVYFGGTRRKDAGSSWERFWIVPAGVVRFDASKDGLSLFDLPLKVNTQKMRWERGKLVDDPRGASSPGALAFQRWFSERYDSIADEVVLTPPAGSGISKPVAIFHELRRIATIAAAAERLRDQGHPMPAWMLDYPVSHFPVPQTTPALSLRRTREDATGVRVAQIYGGVNLSPADQDVHIYVGADHVSVPGAYGEFVDGAVRTAAWLAPRIEELARAATPTGTVQSIAAPDGTTLSVATLPGAGTRALLPNRQQATDLSVPIGVGREIGLTRFYHSFFDPAGEFGQGWSLDLPRLTMTPTPVRRDGTRAQFRLVPHVRSPLGTITIPTDEAAILEGHCGIIGGKTRQMRHHDGMVWHFNDAGRLVLVQTEGMATRYLWGGDSRLIQIVGYVGAEPVASIDLAHDGHGRISEATVKQSDSLRQRLPASSSKVVFLYDDNGRLARVKYPAAGQGVEPRVELTYTYDAHHLTAIGGPAEASFGYGEGSRLLWVKKEGRKTEFTLRASPEGTILRKSAGAQGEAVETWTFDHGMRPVRADFGGGETTQWHYGNGRAVSEAVWREGRLVMSRSVSEDGRTQRIEITGGPAYEERRDVTGRPTDFLVNGIAAAHLSWHSSGTLDVVRMGDTEMRPRRDKDGRLAGVLISAPMDRGRTTQWLEESWDTMGRPRMIADSSGLKYGIQYDQFGRVQAMGRIEDHGTASTRVIYTDKNQIERIERPWGKETRAYTATGALSRVEAFRMGTASTQWFDEAGRLKRSAAFDGGVTIWSYGTGESGERPSDVELPGGQRIAYVWRSSGKGLSNEAAIGPAQIRTQSDEQGRVTAIVWRGRR